MNDEGSTERPVTSPRLSAFSHIGSGYTFKAIKG